MTYRRSDDEKWWPVSVRAIPVYEALEVRLTDGTESTHAGLGDDGVWGFGRRPVPPKRVAAWRYQLPPTFRFPGDPPGSWTCPDHLYDHQRRVMVDVYVDEEIL